MITVYLQIRTWTCSSLKYWAGLINQSATRTLGKASDRKHIIVLFHLLYCSRNLVMSCCLLQYHHRSWVSLVHRARPDKLRPPQHSGTPPMPPQCSILKNQGKTSVLPVVPTMVPLSLFLGPLQMQIFICLLYCLSILDYISNQNLPHKEMQLAVHY